ncbi:MAG: four-carbon acid sugar kinase family protein [Candidatus Binatia bacterium]
MTALRVIADDLTGACDIGAELLPWPNGVAVVSTAGEGGTRGVAPQALWVRNTQSRTLEPGPAAERVTAALREVTAGWSGIVLKKIDTGLRGQLGAEIDAAMVALGADEAFVLAAIPEVGRTTEGGRQMIGGVPVDQTAFARDPRNPIRDARVASVIEATSRRRAGVVPIDAVRDPARFAETVGRLRAAGASILVCDAQTDDDVERGVRGLLGRGRPLLLVGSTGLARGLRRVLGTERDGRPRSTVPAPPGEGGILCVVGSAHPASRAQVEHARARGLTEAIVVDATIAPEDAGQAAARQVRAGRTATLLTPADLDGAAGTRLRAAALAALARSRPSGMVLVGGETAYDVLDGLGHPPLWIGSRLCPLVVRGHLLAGAYAGLSLVTKGGSAGAPDLLGQIVRQLARRVR